MTDSLVIQTIQLAERQFKIAMGGASFVFFWPGTLMRRSRRGPISDFESSRIIGDLQFRGAQTIMNGPLAPVTGAVKSVHTYLAMYVLGSGTLRIASCALTQLDW
jgi:hypothetical protein